MRFILVAERDYALGHLRASRKLFLDSVAGVSDEQWNYKPSPERWSIAECAEHIAVSEDRIGRLVAKSLLAPATPENRLPAAEARARDERLVAVVTDRSHKVRTPGAAQPARVLQTIDETLHRFRASRDANIEFVEKTEDHLRDHFAPHPFFGPLDLYQWFLFAAAHSERHTMQLLEVKGHTGFPR